jgi:hypothetical protein
MNTPPPRPPYVMISCDAPACKGVVLTPVCPRGQAGDPTLVQYASIDYYRRIREKLLTPCYPIAPEPKAKQRKRRPQ